MSDQIATTTEIIEEARSGRMFILVDDEARENEGDLVIPAQFAAPAAINFMAKNARGLICLTLTRERAEQLSLSPMTSRNQSRHATAFTVSIEAREGITTGISAYDRAHTIAIAINPSAGAADIVSPGHVFPLMARDGGTLVRAGHTEAAVDIAALAGLYPAGVICEIMKDDGTMARLPDLVVFARQHGLKLGTIADLIEFRRRTERLVRMLDKGEVSDREGRRWMLYVFHSDFDRHEHLALVMGEPGPDAPVMVRIYAEDPIDLLLAGKRQAALAASMEIIAKEGRGVVVLIRGVKPALEAARARIRQEEPYLLKDYGIGAQILVELGVRRMILLSNVSRPIVGLEGYGLAVVEHRPIGDLG